jgi:hypothetical protein
MSYETDPRSYALELVENQMVSAAHLLLCALKYMSHDDCRGMLDANELSPRFDEEEDEPEEFELEDEDDVRDCFWDEHPEYHRQEGWTQNPYDGQIRTAFVNWLDGAHREGRLSDDLAQEVTL